MIALNGEATQLSTAFETGISASNMQLASSAPPEPRLPQDSVAEATFDWPMYAAAATSEADVPLFQELHKDMLQHNRLPPRAVGFMTNYIRSRMTQLNGNNDIKYFLLGALAFYPEDISINILLSCCYTSTRDHVVQAHICRQLDGIAAAEGRSCSEAQTNLSVAYMMLVSITTTN